jgi:hypothetical protein
MIGLFDFRLLSTYLLREKKNAGSSACKNSPSDEHVPGSSHSLAPDLLAIDKLKEREPVDENDAGMVKRTHKRETLIVVPALLSINIVKH